MSGFSINYSSISSFSFIKWMLFYCLIMNSIVSLYAYSKDSMEIPSKQDEDKVEHLSDTMSYFFELMKHSALGKRLLDPDAMMEYIVGTSNEQKIEQKVKAVSSILNQLVKNVKKNGWKETLAPLKDKAIDQICDFVSASLQIANSASPQIGMLSDANDDNSRRRDQRSFSDLFL